MPLRLIADAGHAGPGEAARRPGRVGGHPATDAQHAARRKADDEDGEMDHQQAMKSVRLVAPTRHAERKRGPAIAFNPNAGCAALV